MKRPSVEVEGGQNTIAVVTAILNGDFATSATIVDSLDTIGVQALVGGLVGAFHGMALHLAAETGTPVQVLEERILQQTAATVAQMAAQERTDRG